MYLVGAITPLVSTPSFFALCLTDVIHEDDEVMHLLTYTRISSLYIIYTNTHWHVFLHVAWRLADSDPHT